MKTDNKLLWYKEPAKNWNEALPIGNGRLGGMVFGKVTQEEIQLNEDSVWYGGKRDRINPDAYSNLRKVRELLSQGKLNEAEELVKLCFSGIPKTQRHYEPLGDINIHFSNIEEYTNYYRELDLKNAIAKSTFTSNNIEYHREVFTSYPEQVLVMRLTASKEKSISFKASLDRGNTRNFDTTVPCLNNSIIMEGETGGKNGIAFTAVLRVKADDGSLQTLGNHICVKGATKVTIFLAAATTYRFENPERQCLETLKNVEEKSYEELKKEHINEYQTLFNRMELEITDEAYKGNLPTDERLELMKRGETDIDLVNTYFHFGRYLMISSSRPNSLPATLQGIWNDQMLPPWDSKYTLNINAEMNYWPAEVCNLSDCHIPLLRHIETMKESGRETAKRMYNARGFTAHHNTDIWGDTAPQDIYTPASYWPLGAAWLCLHLWEHYEFTKDMEYLKSTYDTMKEAAIFFVDFLIVNKDGLYITTPSVSPENTYLSSNGEKGNLCEAPAMDSQIIYELFSNCIKASELLNEDKEFREQLLDMIDKLPPIKVGKYGQIQEWLEDFEEVDPGHRHISHLFALHPGNQISPTLTPELARAAEVTLNRRLEHGGGHTGWSRAWIINMWARLYKSENAYNNILELLRSSTLPNLFDNHPPFQIDGNFGGIAAIAEMIIQSHNQEIHMLPSLPKAWENGFVSGIKARGGFELELEWQHYQLTYLNISSVQSGPCRLRINSSLEASTEQAIMTKVENQLFEFYAEKDQVYKIKFTSAK